MANLCIAIIPPSCAGEPPQPCQIAPQLLFCCPIGPLFNEEYSVVLNKEGGGH